MSKAPSVSKAALIVELRKRRRIGAMMSNVCYNFGQHPKETPISILESELFRDLAREWDAIERCPLPEKQEAR
jgi:hypothetical protein